MDTITVDCVMSDRVYKCFDTLPVEGEDKIIYRVKNGNFIDLFIWDDGAYIYIGTDKDSDLSEDELDEVIESSITLGNVLNILGTKIRVYVGDEIVFDTESFVRSMAEAVRLKLIKFSALFEHDLCRDLQYRSMMLEEYLDYYVAQIESDGDVVEVYLIGE